MCCPSSLLRRGLWVALAVLLLGPQAARAAWLGYADGDYLLALECDFSNVIACPVTVGGTMTITGGTMTALEVTINGETFNGDPDDGFYDGTLADFHYSYLQHLPVFSFLSLRLITDGQIGNYGAGDRWWVYCNNSNGGNACTPSTTGTWSARLVNGVPEPATAALVGLALAGLGARRHRRGG